MNKGKQTVLTAVDTISYIQSIDAENEDELGRIDLLLKMINAGKSKDILTSSSKEFHKQTITVKQHFEKNKREYVVIVGDCRIPKQQVLSLTTSFGIPTGNVKLFGDFSKLKEDFPYEAIFNEHCVAVIVGPVPHSAEGTRGHRSPLEAICNSKNGSTYHHPELKLTKESIRSHLRSIVEKITRQHGQA